MSRTIRGTEVRISNQLGYATESIRSWVTADVIRPTRWPGVTNIMAACGVSGRAQDAFH
jgi:hypothetical protein